MTLHIPEHLSDHIVQLSDEMSNCNRYYSYDALCMGTRGSVIGSVKINVSYAGTPYMVVNIYQEKLYL